MAPWKDGGQAPTPTLFKDFQGGFTTNMGPLAYDQVSCITASYTSRFWILITGMNYIGQMALQATVSFHARSSGNGVYPAFLYI